MTARDAPGLRIDCADLVELVTDYLDGALEPDAAAEVAAHLALCPGCAAYIAQVRATTAGLGSVPVESLPPEVRESLIEAFRDFRRSST